jgi:hypothetical protein
MYRERVPLLPSPEEKHMGQKWIDDQTTLARTAPEIIEQEACIAQQRARVHQLNATGYRDLAIQAGRVLEEMCDALARMRRDERAAKIELRERSFDAVSDQRAAQQVVRD